MESVKILPKRGSEGGVAAFVDFVDIKSAQKAHNAANKMGDRDLRTDYNEPGTIPSAARGLDDTLGSLGGRARESTAPFRTAATISSTGGYGGGGGSSSNGGGVSLRYDRGRIEG